MPTPLSYDFCNKCIKSIKTIPLCSICDNHKKYDSHIIKAGMKFGKLITIKKRDRIRDGSVVWLCKCDCENTISIRRVDLLFGKITQCHSCSMIQKVEKYKNER